MEFIIHFEGSCYVAGFEKEKSQNKKYSKYC